MSELYLKIVLIGDTFTGKTSLLLKYTDNAFPEMHIATIGVEFKEKSFMLNNRKITLQIWDTSGQERFRSLTQNFYRNADGILFVFDVTNKDSFDHIKNWLMDSQEVNLDAKKILIGNKIDLLDQRVITKEKMEQFGEKKDMKSYEASAKTGENVDKIFTEITELILANTSEEKINELYQRDKQNTSISSEDSRGKIIRKKCC